MQLTMTHVALTLVVTLWPVMAVAQPAGEIRPLADPLWVKVILGMAVVIAAMVTGGFALKQTRKKFEHDMKMADDQLRRDIDRIDQQIKIQLSADVQRIERQIEAQLRADVRTQAARLRERYVNALPFHTRLLKQQTMAVRDKLAHDPAHQMQGWFKDIKAYGAGSLHGDDPHRAAWFSAWCHYEGIFALSTLYYTSVFFWYSQEIRALSPFSELDAAFGKRLEGHLQQVSDAFAQGGLWAPVQNNMGVAVKKDEWYKSYPEFCRLFIDMVPTREDHVFLRALDFFGALDKPPYALLDTKGAEAIVQSLDELLQGLAVEEAARRGISLTPPDAPVSGRASAVAVS